MIANTPKPPYIAAVFTSIRTDVEEGYEKVKEIINGFSNDQHLRFYKAKIQ